MADDLELRQLQARQAALRAAQQLGATDPAPAPSPESSMQENMLSGQGILGISPQEAGQMAVAPFATPAYQAMTNAPSAATAGEIMGGMAGGAVPTGRLPGLLAAGARMIGAGGGSFLGSLGGSGGDVEEAKQAGARGMLGEGIGEMFGGIFRKLFKPQTFLPGAKEAQAYVKSKGGHLTTSQLVEGGIGKWLQDFVEMAVVGSKPIKRTKEEAERLVQTGLDEFIAQFPNFPREEAGRLLHRAIQRSGWATVKKGRVRPDGTVVKTRVQQTPYTGQSIEMMASREAAYRMAKQAPDLAFQTLQKSKSETLVRQLRKIMGPEWDVIQGQYLRDLAVTSQKTDVGGGISGSKFWSKVKTVNDPVFKEFFPDPTQRKNILMLARTLKIAETSPRTPTTGALAAQTAVFGGAGIAYGIQGLKSAVMFVATPFALGKLTASKGFTELMTEGAKSGLTVAKTTGLLTRMAALAGELELVPGQDFELVETQ